MKPFILTLGAVILAATTAGCACNPRQASRSITGFPRLRSAKDTVVVCSSIKIGDVGNATVRISRFQVVGAKDFEWAVALYVGDVVYLRPQELTPLIAGIDRLIEVPLEEKGYDRVVPRYLTRDGNLTITRSKQPGPTVNGVTANIGYRYDLNEWYTDLAGLQKFKGLLADARAKLREMQ